MGKRCRFGPCRALSVGRGGAWHLRLRAWVRKEGLLKRAHGAPAQGFTWWMIWYARVVGEVRGMSRSRRLTRRHQLSIAHERAAGEYVWTTQLLHERLCSFRGGQESVQKACACPRTAITVVTVGACHPLLPRLRRALRRGLPTRRREPRSRHCCWPVSNAGWQQQFFELAGVPGIA